MLHMLVNRHSEESCAFRSKENRETLLGGFAGLEKAAPSLGVTLEGTWVNMASHTVFALIDAPNAHVVDELIRDAGLVGHTDSTVFAVLPMDVAVEAVPE